MSRNKTPPKIGKFKLTYSTAAGMKSTIDGTLCLRGEALIDATVAALSFGEDCVIGLKELLDNYIAEVAIRRAETEAKGTRTGRLSMAEKGDV